MAALINQSPVLTSLANRNETAFNRAALTVTHTAAAEALGVTKSTQSDWCTDHLRRACQVFAAYGLLLVPKDSKFLSTEEYRAFLKQQRRHIDRELEEMGDTQPGELI